jgi:hypothetical protein
MYTVKRAVLLVWLVGWLVGLMESHMVVRIAKNVKIWMSLCTRRKTVEEILSKMCANICGLTMQIVEWASKNLNLKMKMQDVDEISKWMH